MNDSPLSWIDRTALGLSGLCLVHCLAGAVLLAALSVGGGLWSHDVHAIGLAAAAPLAAFGLWRGARLHRRPAVLVIGGAGLVLMAASISLGHGSAYEIGLSVAGVALLGVAHLLNLRWSGRHA